MRKVLYLVVLLFSVTQGFSQVILTTTQTDVFCFGSCDGQIDCSATSGTPPYDYSIDNGLTYQTAFTFSGLCAGTYTVIARDVQLAADTMFVTITEPTALISTILSQSDVTCNGLCDGSAQASASGGIPPYSYTWDGGLGAGASVSGVCAGTYTCSVTDANGCVATNTVTITEPTPISTTITTTDVTCNGVCDGTAVVNATGGVAGFTYQWDDPSFSTTTVVNNLCAGTYTVTVTDANGCVANAVNTITEPTPLVVTTSTINSNCGQADGQISSTVSGGIPPYMYQWDANTGNQTTANVSNLLAGCYDLAVTDNNGCAATQTTCVADNAPGSASISTITNVTCNGGCDGFAQANIVGGTAPFTYTWYDGVSNVIGSGTSATGLCAGIYSSEITDVNGCIANVSLTITEPTAVTAVISSQTDATCNGSCDGFAQVTVAGGSAPYSYSWNDPLSQTSDFATNLCAGVYSCAVTDANNCTEVVNVTINEPAPITFSVTPVNQSSCGAADGSLNLAGLTASTSYNVGYTDQMGSNSPVPMTSDAGGNISIVGLAAGQFTDVIVDFNGCQNVDGNIYTITAPSAPFITETNVAIVNTTCAGNDGGISGLTVSGGAAPYLYAFNGQSSPNVDLLNAGPGTYALTVTDANGCSTTSNAFTINYSPSNITLSITGTNASCNGVCDGSLTASVAGGVAPYTYQWSNGQSGATGANMCAGTYTLFVTDANGCEGTAVGTVAEPTSLVNSVSTTQPTCGVNNGSATIDLTTGGTSPYSYQWSNGSFTETADSLQSGIYSVSVTDANGCSTLELINIVSASAPAISSILTSPTCFGGSNGSINLTITGGTAPITYDWSTGASTEDISNLVAGIYDVTISDASGCSITEIFTLAAASKIDLTSFTTSPASCGNSDGVIAVTASGGAGNYNYLWSSGGTSSIESNLAAGTYTLSVSDGNSCLAMKSYSVSNASGPTITIDQVNQPTCQGGSGDIFVSVTGGTAPYSYNWSNGSTNEDLLNAAVGNYELIVTDASGCQGVEYSELLGINLNAAEICLVTVDTATGSNLIVWTKENNLGISDYEIYRETSIMNTFQLLGSIPFNQLSQFVDSSANSGVHSYRYKLRTIDSCGNASDFLAYHKTIHLVSNIGLNNTINLAWDDYVGFTYTTCYINRYHPTTGWVTIDSVSANVHSYSDNSYPNTNGLEYGIEVRPLFPCTAEKAQDHNSTRSNRASITGPNVTPNSINQEVISNVSVFPNPTNGNLSIVTESVNWSYYMYDINGKLITSKTEMNSSIETLNISNVETGVYTLKLFVNDTIVYRKIIKQ